MAVVTAAVAAVTAAIVTTSVATVAAAAVAVSTLIGVVGIGVTAVGMVTKNESLLKAGKIMGYVGLAGGIAGWAAGSMSVGAGEFANQMSNLYSNAWDQGVGSFFKPDPAIAGAQQEALGKGIVAAANPDYAANMAPSFVGYSPAEQQALGQGVVAGTQSAAPAAPVASISPVLDPGAAAQPVASQPLGSSGPAAPTGPATPTGPAAPHAPVTPTGPAAPTGPTGAPSGGIPGPAAGEGIKTWWDKVPDWQKAQLMLTAGQGVAGMASGWMAGLSAEERLELDQLIANRNEMQRQLINRNNAYAPKLGFQKTGMIGAAGGNT